ncbi:MAG: hypothetical protein ACYSVY_29670 [Planctomycetota bacterium]|jgi:hypothetical protein
MADTGGGAKASGGLINTKTGTIAQIVTAALSIPILIFVLRATYLAGGAVKAVELNQEMVQANTEQIKNLSLAVTNLAVSVASLATASEERRDSLRRELDALSRQIREGAQQ